MTYYAKNIEDYGNKKNKDFGSRICRINCKH